MVTNDYLQKIIDGEIGVIDSTQAVAVAKELLAAREAVMWADKYEAGFSAFDDYRAGNAEVADKLYAALTAWRKAAE